MSNNSTFAGNTSASSIYTQYLNVPSIQRSSLRLWFAIFLALSLVGIINNGVLFLVIIRSRTLRSGAGVLILHGIVNCFITCAVHNPIVGVLIYGDNFWFARPRDICKYVHFLLGLTQFANNWAEASLAVNRLIAVIFPFAYKTWSTRKVTGMMIIICWAISAACLIPYLFEAGGKFGPTDQGQCVVQMLSKLGSIPTVIAIYLPYGIVGLIAVAVFAFLTVRTVRGGRVDGPLRPGSPQSVSYRRRLAVTKMLLISFLFDMTCSVTQPMVQAAFPAFYAASPLLRLWLRLWLAVQFPATPVILLAYSKEYRSHFWKWLQSLKAHFGVKHRVAPQNPSKTGVSISLPVDTRM
ncbi:hypothetical protein BV898_17055 [Hypsibius exemplaris]|uniref:G-protein coupled receptors family 1 profile domain-containing protein n=1 Tax=Hypsibius exemplaris TaxID=2072580 RepID=A0A9X6NEL6_HYPEX|nr:hypothetical protein BV898_17055 [Hypsibius exemplaris]